jgi:hypothetical protein
MGNLLDHRRRCERIDQSRRDVTFPLWRSTAEKIVYIFLLDLSKRKHCLYQRPADFSYEKPDEISITLRLMHDGIDKSLPKQVGSQFGHNARSATSRC